MRQIFVLFTLACVMAFGSEVSFAQSDFIERLINFVIFFLILWYFGASKIKQIFLDRQEGISSVFNRTQEEEQRIKREKEKVKQALQEAKSKASEIISLAKKDSYLISQKYEEKLDRDIKMIVANNEQKLQQQEREMIQEEVQRSLDEICQNLQHDSEYYARAMIKGMKQ